MNIQDLRINRDADIKEYYKEVNGIKLPVHIFYPDNHKTTEKKPAIVCIHGGSFRGIVDNSEWNGSTMYPQARYYASRGIVGVAIGYRNFVQPEDRTEDVENYFKISDLYEDCRDAIAYLRENADRFSIDKDKIAVMGDSAGGYLAACLSTLCDTANAVIACNLITDLTDEAWIRYVECNTKTDALEKAKEISPLYNIKPNNIPMLLMHGNADDCVFLRHSLEFYEKMKEAHNECDLKVFDDAKHAFIILNYTATDAQIEAAMDEADKFLITHKFLKERNDNEN